ncbi:MAG TPA: ATP-binding protein, partial [Acidobacteriota bacterium]|nr:ATP-binding protein [Acidobacteriota bacterium]
SGLVRYRRGEWTLFDTQSGKLSDDVILSLLETIESDGSKTLWVGTLRGGLTRFHNGQWTQVSSAQDGITSSRIFCILETREPDGTQVLWFGTRNGLIRYKNDEWTAVGKEHSTLSTNSIYCLAETGYGDGSKALWVGTNVGLFRLYQNQWTAFDLTNGLPNNQVRDLEVIVAANGTQSLWIATRGGVSTLDLDVPDAEIIPLASTDAPPVGNNVVYRIQQDAQRRIYLSTLRGITRFSPRVPTVENRSPFAAYTYTTEDGLPSNECNAGASMIDRAGRLWFGTIGGATFFDPTQEIPDLMAKPLRLESLLINGSPLFRAQGLTQLASEWNTGHEFAHDENNIVIEYSLLSYFREPDSQYCTQLVGLQDRPTPWTTEAKTVYTTLPQGHYRFKVWGRDYAGNISGPVEIGFTIRPAPWVTWWAFVIYGVVVVGGGYSGYQWRVFRFRQANAQLEAKIRERTAALAKSEALTKEKADELARLVTKLSISEQQAQEAKEEALVQRQQALEASKAKSLFLANMSHELRTPLNAILGFVQLLNRVPGRSDEDREYLGIIIRSGEHLLNLINNILSLSKIEAGQVVLEEKTFDLRMLLTELEGLFRFRAQTKHLRFAIEFPPELPRFVVGDERKLRQVLINLLGNAFKFTERGEVKLKVSRHQELATFEVSDTGAGIAPAEIGKIFQPFTQTQSGLQAQEGTGLGLTISQDFVNVMGGEITVESQFGRGTTFRFAINLPAVMAGATSIKPKTVIGLATGQPVFRLLVVDDMVENRQLLTTLLKQFGFDVQDAANGAEALTLWQNWRPHLVWMDMHMPVLDGFEATRQIRATESAGKSGASNSISEVPTWIISISASAFDADRTAILEAGCDDIVIKPFSTDVIVEKLVKYLGVEFTYESSSEITTETHQACAQPESLKQAIASLAPELRTQLYEAVLGCNREKVYGVAEHIHSVDPILAQELHHLARQYQFEELLTWFD